MYETMSRLRPVANLRLSNCLTGSSRIDMFLSLIHIYTKAVVKNYLNDERTRSYLIFSNPLKVFSKDILGKPIEKINSENVQRFNFFAFMNFFQMPSLYKGMKFWDSLRKSGETNRHWPMWDECVTKSSEVLDKVIDILEPKLVVFLSTSAYNAFKKSNARHAGDEIIQQTVHPCSPWW